MKLKKLVIGLTVCLSLLTLTSNCLAEEVSDATLRNMINMYKKQNYVTCNHYICEIFLYPSGK